MKRLLFFLLTLVMVSNAAFAQGGESATEPALAITTQPVAISIAQKDKSVTLSCTASKGESEITYQWFQNTVNKNTGGTAIPGATSADYTTATFPVKEIRYYYCVATVGEERVTSSVAVVAYTGLPTLYINTEIALASITKVEYVFGDMRFVFESGDEFAYTFKKEKDGVKKEGVKGRGNSSWSMPKKGYSIKFDSKQSFFGLPESKKWCINANYADKTLLRNKLASVLATEVYNSDWNPTFNSVDVVWNGEYRGNYIFCERNVIGNGRVDIQDISDLGGKKFIDQNGDGVVDWKDGGYILEIDNRDDAEFVFKTTKGVHVTLKDPEEVPEEIQTQIQAYVQSAENALYAANFEDVEEGWRKYFDENSVIDWFWVNEIARNRDARSFSSIYKYYSPTESILHYGPIWDFDIGFGNDGEKGNQPSQGITTGWYIKNGTWTVRMFEDSAFVANVFKRWKNKKTELEEIVSSKLQELADANAVSAECNFLKWNILGKYVWPNPLGYEERTTYQSEVDYMKNWISERCIWLDNAINNSFYVTCDLKGGILAKANKKVFIAESTSAFTLNNPTKEGYIFAGWSGTGITGLSKSVKVTNDKKGNKLFTANWNRDFMLCDVTLSATKFDYTGSEIAPEITIKDGDYTLVENKDYTVSLPDGRINTGDYVITITGIGNFEGEFTKTFSINPAVVIAGALTKTTDQNGITVDINGDSDEPLIITESFTAKTVTYSRSFKENITSTVMLPFEVSTTGKYGSFYTMKNITSDESDVWTITTSDAPSKLSANTPYMFKPSCDFIKIDFKNVEFMKTEDGVTTFGENDEWKFQGVYSLKEWAQRTPTDFGFAATKNINNDKKEIEAGQFVRAGKNSKIKATRAYLTYDEKKISKSATSLPDKIIVLFPDETEDEEEIIVPIAEDEEISEPVAENEEFLTPVSEIVTNAGVKVWSFEKTIFIEGREGMEYSIVDMGGRRMMQTTTKSDREEIHLNGNPNGIMIVRIAGQSFKVMY